MSNQTFLDKLSAQLEADYGPQLSGITIVLPNKRAQSVVDTDAPTSFVLSRCA